jgi:hypothetical protein
MCGTVQSHTQPHHVDTGNTVHQSTARSAFNCFQLALGAKQESVRATQATAGHTHTACKNAKPQAHCGATATGSWDRLSAAGKAGIPNLLKPQLQQTP